jgi:hypothetical protein
MLQIGFSGASGASRLPVWLEGYGQPETITTLLSQGDENASTSFQRLWNDLRQSEKLANTGRSGDSDLQIQTNPWYPRDYHDELHEALARIRRGTVVVSRVEDENDRATLFAIPRLRDDHFEVALSTNVPAAVAGAKVLHIRFGSRRVVAVRSERGELELQHGLLRVELLEGLRQRAYEVQVLQGTECLHRERVELWQESDDISIYKVKSGLRVRELADWIPETDVGYAVLARATVLLEPEVESSGSADWRLYIYPNGFTKSLVASVDGFPLWKAKARIGSPMIPTGVLYVREMSLTQVEVHVRAVPGRTVERFRIRGRVVVGDSAKLTCSPDEDWEGRSARAEFHQAGAAVHGELCAQVEDWAQGAASLQPDGTWAVLDGETAIDGACLEDRTLVTRWRPEAEDEPWLMLGHLPLRVDPHRVRTKQTRGMGERLELRFGLMNEIRPRLTLAANVYYSGQLAGVSRDANCYMLRLREPVERADELDVHVWEENSCIPRLLPREHVTVKEDHALLTVKTDEAIEPIGWAISFGGKWRGARFPCEPNSRDTEWSDVAAKWTAVMRKTKDTTALVQALCWWKFPMLMDPFRDVLAARAKDDGCAVLRGMTSIAVREGLWRPLYDPDLFAPMRDLLWGFHPSATDCIDLFEHLVAGSTSIIGDERGAMLDRARFVLDAHPVLFALILCSFLEEKRFERERSLPTVPIRASPYRGKDPLKRKQIAAEIRGAVENIIGTMAQAYGCSTNVSTALPDLRAYALQQLKSWADKEPLNEHFFTILIEGAAKALFAAQPSEAVRLKTAIARAPACASYLAAVLLHSYSRTI